MGLIGTVSKQKFSTPPGLSLSQEISERNAFASQKISELRFLFSNNTMPPLGTPLLNQLKDLSQETDNFIFWSDVHSIGSMLLRQNRVPEALVLFHWMVMQPYDSPIPKKFRDKAAKSLAAYSGGAPLGQRLEPLFANFSQAVLHPAGLGGMVAGGLAYRLGRFRAFNFFQSRMSNGLALRLLGSGAGLASEVPVFLFTAKGMNTLMGGQEDWSAHALGKGAAQLALLLGALRLSGYGSRCLTQKWIQGTAPFQEFSRRALPQLGMWIGIMGGHSLEDLTGINSDQEGAGVLVDSLITLLHFNIAGQVIKKITPRRFQIFENQMDQEIEAKIQYPWFRFPDPPDSLALAFPGSSGRLPTASPTPLPLINTSPGPARLHSRPRDQVHSSSSYGDLLSGEKAFALKKHFVSQFPSPGPLTYSVEIIDSALLTPSRIPYFHERLLESYSKAPNPGTKNQFYTSLALENIFKFNPLATSGGSFDQALIQIYTVQALSDGFKPSKALDSIKQADRRQQAMDDLFKLMEGGYQRSTLLGLFDKHQLGGGFTLQPPQKHLMENWNLHPEERREVWGDYRPKDRELLYAFVLKESFRQPGLANRWAQVFAQARKSPLYPDKLIDHTLDYARENPNFAHLVLRRMAQIFATRNLPAKLREITYPSVPGNNFGKILELMGRDPKKGEGVARLINGSYLTAGVEDIRLARKVVSVIVDINEWIRFSPSRQKAAQKFTHAVEKFSQSGKRLTEKALIKILMANPNPQSRAFYRDWKKKNFELRIISEQEHDKLHQKWGKVEEYDVGLFYPGGGKGGRDLIMIRELPKGKFLEPGAREKSFTEIKDRVLSLIHEWEHWRHFSNHFEGIEKASMPFSLDKLSRQERIVTEMMSYLEEQRWRVKTLDVDAWQIAHRSGDNIIYFLRDLADQGYFGRVNDSFSGK